MESDFKSVFIRKFGDQLKKIREERGYSYRQMAQLCDVDHSQISKIEKGKVDIQITTVLELAKGLNVEPKELFAFKVDVDKD